MASLEKALRSLPKASIQERCLELRSFNHPRCQHTEDSSSPVDENEFVFSQFALVDEGLFAYFFSVINEAGEEIAVIDRAWGGIGREVS